MVLIRPLVVKISESGSKWLTSLPTNITILCFTLVTVVAANKLMLLMTLHGDVHCFSCLSQTQTPWPTFGWFGKICQALT